MVCDTVMYAISSDNDNQDNNYTKPGSSITVTYHLNNQALKRTRGGEERRDPGLWEPVSYVSQRRSTSAASIQQGIICIAA